VIVCALDSTAMRLFCPSGSGLDGHALRLAVFHPQQSRRVFVRRSCVEPSWNHAAQIRVAAVRFGRDLISNQ
jgi:hypothetical protein